MQITATIKTILIVSSLILTACQQGGSQTTVDSSEVFRINYEKNFKIWQENSEGQSYIYSYSRSCFCLEEFAETRVSVGENGQITQVQKISPIGTFETLSVDEYNQVVSIEKLFEIIKKKIDNKVAHVDVEYDKELGFPSQIYVDYDFRMADDEVSYVINELEF
ncbi:MAG: hypothetical protein H6625_09920 [Bdellovibrionaceae bacterium]|nr:hypothetical protein [Pseudobdellovibrionaceae bacterium]